MTLGETILAARKSRGWSQAHLAELSGVKQQTIAYMELDTYKTPGMDKLQKIAFALEINPKILFRLAGYPVESQTEQDKIIDELAQYVERMKELVNKLRNNT